MRRQLFASLILGLIVLPEPITSAVGLGAVCVSLLLRNRRAWGNPGCLARPRFASELALEGEAAESGPALLP
ncbi:MAG: hypothetical protein DRI39_04635 [Chloroflexi bacterium]|nr:MAG: hypothetical protein DRI39_04635 [Chloroflexota bacterium]RLC96597.1 MAG: hypothetical protein DRI40_02670 [Chloroflexota bacterium]